MTSELARDKRFPVERRGEWVLLTAALVRAAQGPEAVTAWAREHEATLKEAKLEGRMAELSARALMDNKSCAAAFACAGRRLAGEGSWVRTK